MSALSDGVQDRGSSLVALGLRLGLESDFFPGIERWAEKLHARVPLHHVLGSVHMQVTHYKERYFTGDYFAYQQTYRKVRSRPL